MSHVDEGRLHAWLDYGRSGMSEADYVEIGAHLARCAECSALLAEERELRDRAASILGATGPRASAPLSFEELAAKAHASGQMRPRTPDLPQPGRGRSEGRDGSGRRQIVGLAWAASIMAALGLGWAASTIMEREQLAIQTFETTEDRSAGTAAISREEAVAAADDQSSAKIAAPAAAPVAGGASAEASASPAAAPLPVAAIGQSSRPPAEDAAASVALEERVVVEYGPQARQAESGRVAADQAQAAASPVGAATPRALTAPNAAEPPAAPAALSGRAPAAAPRLESPSTEETAVGAAPETITLSISASAAPFPSPSSLPGMAAMGYQSALIWGVATPEQAAQRLGRQLLVHPAFPLLRVEVPSGIAIPVARVIHALPGGGTLTIIQSRQAEGDAILTTPPGSATTLRGDVVVTGIAPITADSISVLLEGLR